MNRVPKIGYFSNYLYSPFKDCRRFAGHSKWANIKHTKTMKDTQKSLLYQQMFRRMKQAAIDGGSPKPSQNIKLAQLVEVAKKSNMPVATLNGILEKLAKQKTQSDFIEVAGPGGSMFIVHILTDNVVRTRMEVAGKLKKTVGKLAESSSKNLFDHKGVILTKAECDYDKATEDAINAGAEDVEECVDSEENCYKFKCDPFSLPKVKNILERSNYTILSAEEEYVPLMFVELSDEDLEKAAHIRDRLFQLPEVAKIEDNIK